MKILQYFTLIALASLFPIALQAQDIGNENAYRLTFKDDNGIALAEIKFISPKFTPKEHDALTVIAAVRLLENTSETESAGWLKRLLKTGKAVKINIVTKSFKTTQGDVIATTNISFDRDIPDANIWAQYSDHKYKNDKIWGYGLYSGGFDGGTVTFERIKMENKSEQATPRKPSD